MSIVWADERGFTLIEMLISVILMTMALAAVFGVFAYGSSYYTVGDTITNLQRKAYGAMDNIGRTLKEGQTINWPLTGSTGEYLDFTNQDGDNITYFPSNGSLLRNDPDGGDDIILIDTNEGIYVADIQFTNNDPAMTVKLRVMLTDTTVSESGSGNIVLVKGDNGECGEDCIELYTNIILRPRYFATQ